VINSIFLMGMVIYVGSFIFIPKGETAPFSWVKEIQEKTHGTEKTMESENSKILVELFLSKEVKKDLDEIKKEFTNVSIKRIRTQFYASGHAPKNIAIGKSVSAPVARLTIRLANTYNQGIQFLLPERLFFPHYITIGSSAFDEASQVPILQEDIERLSDPSLNTEQFHTLYRSLTGEDKRPQ